jgi:hypothetical protein
LAAQLGRAEVENLCRSIVGDKDICRFEVAMHDAFFVRRQSTRDPDTLVNCFANRQGDGYQQLAERAAVQQLRHEIGRAVIGAEAVNSKNVGMVQRCTACASCSNGAS